jgi:hypothetical protein
MALKSIVEIDIDDTKFKEWLATAHKLTIGINAPTGATTSAPSSSSATTSATTTSDIKFNAEKEKQHKKDKKEWSETDTYRKQESRARKDNLEGLKNFTSSVGSFSASLAKWTAGISTGVVVGAGFGYMRGARETQDEFRRSKELGVNVGQMKALQDTLEPLMDVNTTLANFAEAATSTLKNVSLNLLSQEERLGKTPAEMMLAMIPKLKAELTKVGANDISLQQYMEANKITDLFSMDAIKSLKNNSNEFISSLLELAHTNVKALTLTDKQQQDYAKLNTAFTVEIDKFTQDLKRLTADLAPEITTLIKQFSTFASDVMHTGTFKDSIVKLGDGIKGVADYLATGKLLQSLKDFEAGVRGITNFFGLTTKSETMAGGNGGSGASRNIRNNNPGNLKFNEYTKGLGATGQDEDGFAIFSSMEAGANAQRTLLENKYKKGLDTIHKLYYGSGSTKGWLGSGADLKDAPSAIANVIKMTGIKENQQITPDQLEAIRQAMARNEGNIGGQSNTLSSFTKNDESNKLNEINKVNEFTKNNEFTKVNELNKNNEFTRVNELNKNNEINKLNEFTKSGEPNAAITLTEGMVDISSAFISSILHGISDLTGKYVSHKIDTAQTNVGKLKDILTQPIINLNITSNIPANYNATGATVASQVRGQ